MLPPPQPRVDGCTQQLSPTYGYPPQIPANLIGAMYRQSYSPVQPQVMYNYPQHVGQNGQFVQHYPQAYIGQQMYHQQSYPAFQDVEAAENRSSPIIQEVIEDEYENQNKRSEEVPSSVIEHPISMRVESNPEIESCTRKEEVKQTNVPMNMANEDDIKKLKEANNEASCHEKMEKSKDHDNKTEAVESYLAEKVHHQSRESVEQPKLVQPVQQRGRKISDTHERNDEPASSKEPCKRKNEGFPPDQSPEGKLKKVKGGSTKDANTHEAIPHSVPSSACAHIHDDDLESGRKSAEGNEFKVMHDVHGLTSSLENILDIGREDDAKNGEYENQNRRLEEVPSSLSEHPISTRVEPNPEIESCTREEEARQTSVPMNMANDNDIEKLKEAKNEESYREKMEKSKHHDNKNKVVESCTAGEVEQPKLVQPVQQRGRKISVTHERNDEPASPKEPCKRKNEGFQPDLSPEGKLKKVKGGSTKDANTHEAIPHSVPSSACAHIHEDYMESRRKSADRTKSEMMHDVQGLTTSLKNTLDIGRKDNAKSSERREHSGLISKSGNEDYRVEKVSGEQKKPVFGTVSDEKKTENCPSGTNLFTTRMQMAVNTCTMPHKKPTENIISLLDIENASAKPAFWKEEVSSEKSAKDSKASQEGNVPEVGLNEGTKNEVITEGGKHKEARKGKEDRGVPGNDPSQKNIMTAPGDTFEHKGTPETNRPKRKTSASKASAESTPTVSSQVIVNLRLGYNMILAYDCKILLDSPTVV